MTDTPWTPGPWRAEVVWSDAFGSRLRGSDGRVVAELSIELAPDLRLIAAAPEMADFLTMLEREPFASSPRTRDEARALLARIRGA